MMIGLMKGYHAIYCYERRKMDTESLIKLGVNSMIPYSDIAKP